MAVIGLDIDGVICDARGETEIRFVMEFGWEKWNIVKDLYYTSEHSLVPDGWMRAQFEDPTYWMNCKPHEDGWYMANKWFSEGHTVYAVTARHTEQTLEITNRWFDEWNIVVNDIISKEVLGKHSAVNDLGIDIFVEDNPHEAKSLAAHCASFLIDTDYNRGVNIGGGVRVKSLYDVDKVVDHWDSLKLNAKSAGNISTLQSLLGNTFIERTHRIG